MMDISRQFADDIAAKIDTAKGLSAQYRAATAVDLIVALKRATGTTTYTDLGRAGRRARHLRNRCWTELLDGPPGVHK